MKGKLKFILDILITIIWNYLTYEKSLKYKMITTIFYLLAIIIVHVIVNILFKLFKKK